MKYSKKITISVLFTVILLFGCFGFFNKALADYQTEGVFISTNFLPSSGASILNSFSYTADIPSGTGLKVQFSYNSWQWYDSTGVDQGLDILSDGTHTIDLSARDWEGPYFYYRMVFTSDDGLNTPSLDSVTLAYYSFDGTYYTYETSGTLTSTNILSGKTAISIDSFSYNVSSLPPNTGLKVQFSIDNSNWYDSLGVLDNYDTISVGTNTIDLSGLYWEGFYFYYKLTFTSDGSGTPILDEITLTYYCTATKLERVKLKGIKIK